MAGVCFRNRAAVVSAFCEDRLQADRASTTRFVASQQTQAFGWSDARDRICRQRDRVAHPSWAGPLVCRIRSRIGIAVVRVRGASWAPDLPALGAALARVWVPPGYSVVSAGRRSWARPVLSTPRESGVVGTAQTRDG